MPFLSLLLATLAACQSPPSTPPGGAGGGPAEPPADAARRAREFEATAPLRAGEPPSAEELEESGRRELQRREAAYQEVTGELERALAEAVSRSDHTEAGRLLAAGADPRTVDEDLRPLIVKAAKTSSNEVVAALLGAGADVDAADREGWRAIHEAATRLDHEGVEVLAELLAHRPDLEARIQEGLTPLLLAVHGRRTEAAALLLEAGADARSARREFYDLQGYRMDDRQEAMLAGH